MKVDSRLRGPTLEVLEAFLQRTLYVRSGTANGLPFHGGHQFWVRGSRPPDFGQGGRGGCRGSWTGR